MNLDKLERLLIRRQLAPLNDELRRLLASATPATTPDFERLVSLQLRALIADDDAAGAVALLRRTRFDDDGRVPFELHMLWCVAHTHTARALDRLTRARGGRSFDALQSDAAALRAFALEQLRRTASAMASDRVSQLGYELLRSDYERLIELCLFHVLVPQADHAAARQLLAADAVLSVEKKTVRARVDVRRRTSLACRRALFSPRVLRVACRLARTRRSSSRR